MGPPLRLVCKAGAIALLSACVMVTIVAALPDGSDHARVTLDKHAHLEAAPSPRVVLIGGSNLAYGMDSPALERALGVPVTNMGLNGYLGFAFMRDEVRTSVRRGDVIVVSLEGLGLFHTPEYDPLNGLGRDLLMMVKARPSNASAVRSPVQIFEALRAIPFAGQQKLLRIMRTTGARLLGDTIRPSLMDSIETRAGYNANGDMVAHINVAPPFAVVPDSTLHHYPMARSTIDAIRRFQDEMAQSGVSVYYLPSPMPAEMYEQNRRALQDVESLLHRTLRPGSVLAPFDAYLYDGACFFDDVYHLTGACRTARTDRVAEHLRARLASPAADDR